MKYRGRRSAMSATLRVLLVFVSLLTALFGVGHGAQTPSNRKNPCEDWLESAPYLDAPGLRRSWSRDYFKDVYFATPLRGWTIAGDGTITSTLDGGRSWKSQKFGTPPIGFVSMQIGFRTPQDGWIAAEGQFFTTGDGGQTWRRTAAPVTCTDKIYYVTPQTGWLLSKPNRVFKTTDGGRSWRRQASEIEDMPACFSERECIAGGSNGRVLTTSDGNNWVARKTPLGRATIGEIKLLPNGTAWAIETIDSDSYLLRSDDKGKSWTVIGGVLHHVINGLMFQDKRNGVIVNIGFYWTNDGGVTWNSVKLPDGDLSLHAAYFVDENLGWAVGQSKTILHTTNGGKTWIKQHEEVKRYPVLKPYEEDTQPRKP